VRQLAIAATVSLHC